MSFGQRVLKGKSSGRRTADTIFRTVCLLSALTAVFFLIYLLSSVFRDGTARLSLDFLQGFSSRNPDNAGIQGGLIGTLWVISLTVAMAVPVGVAAAVYLEEFASKRSRWTSLIQLNIANLAAVPSIVYGILGLTAFVTFFGFGRSILAAACTMALLILPMIIVVSQEAIKAVPSHFREGSLALGATTGQTILRQILPNALPGIITGIILSVSRAIGETAPLIVVGAVAVSFRPPAGLDDKFTVLPIQIFDWSSRPQTGFHEIAASAIIVLMVTLLALNLAAILIRARSQKKL